MSGRAGRTDPGAVSYDVVVPTLKRPSLKRLLAALDAQPGRPPRRPIVVEDRDGKGPAAARNRGWRESEAEWVVFLDDDVVPSANWSEALVEDLAGLGPRTGGSQGRIEVPLPRDRRPTDWERNVAGLERARWASADVAYRRSALERAGGFDERFQRAYREDSDLALRVQALGLAIAQGRRRVSHPPGPASFWRSVSLQRGNADDALMRRLHGRNWRAKAGAPRGRLAAHVAISVSAVIAPRVAALGIAELAWRRIAPGPKTAAEVTKMLATSAVIPFAATFHRLRGELRWRGAKPLAADRPVPNAGPASAGRPAAVLLDRDGTLIEDVPYNGDPRLVKPRPGASEALKALREANVPVAVISNQSGVARGLISEEQVRAVNGRAEELLGAIDAWLYCPHGPEDGCSCRKPAPGLVQRAADVLGVPVRRCTVIGDIEADVQAALAAGAQAVLVPNGHTRPEEVVSAPASAPDLRAAVALLLGERP